MDRRRLCILGGCGGIGRSLVAAGIAAGYDLAVMDLATALARHPPPAFPTRRALRPRSLRH
jgi:3-oxoacyl-[acyl-carrier protein] reductase